MKQRLNDLHATIEGAGKSGINVIMLVNKFGVVHGLKVSTVKDYLKMLVNGGFVLEKSCRVYFESEMSETV